jgi:hypothetical protein
LVAVIIFLIVLLFLSGSGKYCVPMVKEQQTMPGKISDKDSLAGAGSSGTINYKKDTIK